MNNGLARVIFEAGCRLRGTRLSRYLEELEVSQWWTEDDIREMQLRKLRSLLAHANEHSPFYRRRFASCGLDCRIGSLDDLKALPSIDRKEAAVHRAEIQNAGEGGRLVFSKTAGTTSVPLQFHRSADWDAQHRAAIARGCRWYGIDPWARSAMLWSIPPGAAQRLKIRASDFLLNRFRQKSFEMSRETLEAFHRSLAGVRYLSGYAGMLYELARYINERNGGKRPLSLALVKGTSEKIFPQYQSAALDAFGTRITGEYGAAEAGIIAFECPEGSYHVNMDHVIVQVEDDEIVVTNLISHSFPFIRYRLGDYVKLREQAACPCGRKGLVIEDIMGRVGLRVHGKSETVFPSVVIDLIIKRLVEFDGLVAQCQAVQRTRGELEFHVVPSGPLDRAAAERIERFFDDIMPRYFGDAVDHRTVFVDVIPRGTGKFLEFVSELPRES